MKLPPFNSIRHTSSLAISGELGMRPLMERVLSRRDILKAICTPFVLGLDKCIVNDTISFT